jgi:hypothetical protein
MPKKVKFYADMPTKGGRSVMVNVSGLKVERFIPPVSKIVEHIESIQNQGLKFIPFSVTIPPEAFQECFLQVRRKVVGCMEMRHIPIRIGSNTKVLVIIKQ